MLQQQKLERITTAQFGTLRGTRGPVVIATTVHYGVRIWAEWWGGEYMEITAEDPFSMTPPVGFYAMNMGDPNLDTGTLGSDRPPFDMDTVRSELAEWCRDTNELTFLQYLQAAGQAPQ